MWSVHGRMELHCRLGHVKVENEQTHARVRLPGDLFNRGVNTRWWGEIRIYILRSYILISPHHLVVTPRLTCHPGCSRPMRPPQLRRKTTWLEGAGADGTRQGGLSIDFFGHTETPSQIENN